MFHEMIEQFNENLLQLTTKPVRTVYPTEAINKMVKLAMTLITCAFFGVGVECRSAGAPEDI